MTAIKYELPQPIIINIEHVGCEPSYMNDAWQVLAGDIINYTNTRGKPKQIVLVLERVEK